MICLSLELKEQNKCPSKIIDCYLHEDKAHILFSAIKEKFLDFLLKSDEENYTFCYMKLVDVESNGKKLTISLKPAESFKIEIKQQIINLIKETVKA